MEHGLPPDDGTPMHPPGLAPAPTAGPSGRAAEQAGAAADCTATDGRAGDGVPARVEDASLPSASAAAGAEDESGLPWHQRVLSDPSFLEAEKEAAAVLLREMEVRFLKSLLRPGRDSSASRQRFILLTHRRCFSSQAWRRSEVAEALEMRAMGLAGLEARELKRARMLQVRRRRRFSPRSRRRGRRHAAFSCELISRT